MNEEAMTHSELLRQIKNYYYRMELFELIDGVKYTDRG
jgi:hypothetical protein